MMLSNGQFIIKRLLRPSNAPAQIVHYSRLFNPIFVHTTHESVVCCAYDEIRSDIFRYFTNRCRVVVREFVLRRYFLYNIILVSAWRNAQILITSGPTTHAACFPRIMRNQVKVTYIIILLTVSFPYTNRQYHTSNMPERRVNAFIYKYNLFYLHFARYE